MRVVIADDAALVREGLARLLSEAGVEVAGLAAGATALLELVASEHPDVAVVDIRMPPTHTDEGLVAAETIRELFPATGVLVLSQYVDSGYALRLLESGDGGRGYLLKDRVLDTQALLDALSRVAAGEVVVEEELVDRLLRRPRADDPLDVLTPREREVLALVAEGLTDRAIAERLWLTPRTVETHVRHILRKLEIPQDAIANRRVHAVLTYLRSEGNRRADGPAQPAPG